MNNSMEQITEVLKITANNQLQTSENINTIVAALSGVNAKLDYLVSAQAKQDAFNAEQSVINAAIKEQIDEINRRNDMMPIMGEQRSALHREVIAAAIRLYNPDKSHFGTAVQKVVYKAYKAGTGCGYPSYRDTPSKCFDDTLRFFKELGNESSLQVRISEILNETK